MMMCVNAAVVVVVCLPDRSNFIPQIFDERRGEGATQQLQARHYI